MDGKVFQTSSSAYGKGTNVEVYKDSKYNIHENRDLRALERRLPKGWKKPKWTPRKYALTQLSTPMTLCPRWAERNDLMLFLYATDSYYITFYEYSNI